MTQYLLSLVLLLTLVFLPSTSSSSSSATPVHSEFLFRQTVILSSPYTIANAEILVSFKTSHLDASQCLNLGFTTDPRGQDPAKWLDYWLEGICGGCGMTNVWIRVPEVHEGLEATEVFIFFGCNQTLVKSDFVCPSSPKSPFFDGVVTKRIHWTDPTVGFVAMKITPGNCWDGWTEIAAADGRLLQISGFGTRGNRSVVTVDTSIMSHSHTFTGLTGNLVGEAGYRWDENEPSQHYGFSVILEDHSHPYTGKTTSFEESSIPRHVRVTLCQSHTLTMHPDMMFPFVTYDHRISSLPHGVSETLFGEYGLFLAGSRNARGGEIGGYFDHKHAFSDVSTTYSIDRREMTAYCEKSTEHPPCEAPVHMFTEADHTHSADGTLAAEKNRPPYLDVIYASPDSCDTHVNSSVFQVFATGLPPLGWVESPLVDQYEGRFLRGARTAGSVGGSFQHDHSLKLTSVTDTIDERPVFTEALSTTLAAPMHAHDAPTGAIESGQISNEKKMTNYPYYDVWMITQHAPVFSLEIQRPIHIGDEFNCFGLDYLDALVCSAHGDCVHPDECRCAHLFTSPDCSNFYCGEFRDDDPKVCSGHGNCIAPSHCECEILKYMGPLCDIPLCFDIPAIDRSVCSGHGVCSDVDTCKCTQWNQSMLAKGHGDPAFPFTYTGDDCATPVCWGKSGDSACSGHGICVDSDVCRCDDKYVTPSCGKFKFRWETWMSAAAIGSGSGVVIVCVVILVIVCWCWCCCRRRKAAKEGGSSRRDEERDPTSSLLPGDRQERKRRRERQQEEEDRGPAPPKKSRKKRRGREREERSLLHDDDDDGEEHDETWWDKKRVLKKKIRIASRRGTINDDE